MRLRTHPSISTVSHVQNVGSFDHLVGVVDVEVGGCGPEQLANLQGLLDSEEARIFFGTQHCRSNAVAASLSPAQPC
jgi:hypothetical protein